MRLVKFLSMLIISLSMIFVFSACSGFSMDAESLMEAPLLTQEQAKLKEAISLVAGEDYTPKFPSNGEYSSAFMFYDLDGDEVDEALAFYSTADGKVKANLLKFSDNDWKSLYEIPGEGSSVEYVYFVQLGDGYESVAIKWESEIGIYHLGENTFDMVYSASCDGARIYDFDRNGNSEIAIFSGIMYLRPRVQIIYAKDGQLMNPAVANMTSRYDQIYNMEFGQIENGKYGLFIDSEIHEGNYITEVITFDGKEAVSHVVVNEVTYDEEGEETDSKIVLATNEAYGNLVRTAMSKCCDINSDGIIEIPAEIRQTWDVSLKDMCYRTDYLKYDGRQLQSVWHGLVGNFGDFRMAMPNELDEKILIKYSDIDSEYVFSKYDGSELMRIRKQGSDEYKDIYDTSFISLGNTMGTEFILKVTDENKLSEYLSTTKVAESFEVL